MNELKVIDLSTVLAGPSVGTFFAEIGAEVIKIEHPLFPDVTRSWKLPTEDLSSSISAYFSSVNYGKSYISLNLMKEEDHSKFIDLIKNADILISNFKKGDDLKLNIQTSYLHSINPQLIIGKISGFGEESDRVAYDLILQAETGFMSMNGTSDSGPVKMPVALIDVLAGHQLKEGILLALLHRQVTGKGSEVCVSLYDTAICSLANQASNYLMTGHVAQRIGSLHPNIAPYGELFQTKDAITITLAIGSDKHFEKLVSVLHVPKLAQDKRFMNNQQRIQNRTILAELLQSSIHSYESVELLSKLHVQHVPCAEVKTLDTVFLQKEASDLILSEEINQIQTRRVRTIAFITKND